MHPNTERLHQLMEKHKLTAEDVAEILSREVNTVRVWRVKETVRPIPDDSLRVLEMTLQLRAVKERDKKAKAAAKVPAAKKSSGTRRR